MSSMVFSCRRMAAPSLMMRRATGSSKRPSLVRWAFSRSTRGFPSQSNTSRMFNLWLSGNGTAAEREREGQRKELSKRCRKPKENQITKKTSKRIKHTWWNTSRWLNEEHEDKKTDWLHDDNSTNTISKIILINNIRLLIFTDKRNKTGKQSHRFTLKEGSNHI